MEEDWDLLAVVRSCSTAAALPSAGDDFGALFSEPYRGGGGPAKFLDLVMDPPRNAAADTHTLQGLPELYDPYFDPVKPKPKLAVVPQGKPCPGFSDTARFVEQLGPQIAAPPPQGLRTLSSSVAHFQNATPVLSLLPNHPLPGPKCRRRSKSQQKRMVSEVSADNLSSDIWSWRKYGQKPIKASPHPRNYYRCSSSKGCSARKQVERSPTDPNMFLVTYTGDHNHPRPTHRNSLAGGKFSAAVSATSSVEPRTSSAASVSSAQLSPNTPLNTSMEDEAPQPNTSSISASTSGPKVVDSKAEVASSCDDNDNKDDVDDGVADHEILIPNMVMSEDIFMGWEELGCEESLPAIKMSPVDGEVFSDQ